MAAVSKCPSGSEQPPLAPSHCSASLLDPTSYMLPKKTRRRRKVHELERNYACHVDACDRRYASESALHQHLWLKHQVKRPRTLSNDHVPLAPCKQARPAPYHLPAGAFKPSSPPPLVRQVSTDHEADAAELLRFLSGPTPRQAPPTPPAPLPLRPPGTPSSTHFTFPDPAPPKLVGGLSAQLLAPSKDLSQQTDQELKAELRRLLAMFQTVEAMETVVFSRPVMAV